MNQAVGQGPAQTTQLIRMDLKSKTVSICPRCFHRAHLIFGLLKTPPVCVDCAVDPTWTNPQENWPKDELVLPHVFVFQGEIGKSRIIVQHPEYLVLEQLYGQRELLLVDHNLKQVLKLPRHSERTLGNHVANYVLPNVSSTNSQYEKASVQNQGQLNPTNTMQDESIQKMHTILAPASKTYVVSTQTTSSPLLTSLLINNPRKELPKFVLSDHKIHLTDRLQRISNLNCPHEDGIAIVNSPMLNNQIYLNDGTSAYVRNCKYNQETQAMMKNVQKTNRTGSGLIVEVRNPRINDNTCMVLQHANDSQMAEDLPVMQNMGITSTAGGCCALVNPMEQNCGQSLGDCCGHASENWTLHQDISGIQSEAMPINAQHANSAKVGNLVVHNSPSEISEIITIANCPYKVTVQENVYPTAFQNQTFCCEYGKCNTLPITQASAANSTPVSSNNRCYKVTTDNIIPKATETTSIFCNQLHNEKILHSLQPEKEELSKATNWTCGKGMQEKQMYIETVVSQNMDDCHSASFRCKDFVNPKQLSPQVTTFEQDQTPTKAMDLTCKLATKENQHHIEAAKPSNQDIKILYPYSIFSVDLANSKSMATTTGQEKSAEDVKIMSSEIATLENCVSNTEMANCEPVPVSQEQLTSIEVIEQILKLAAQETCNQTQRENTSNQEIGNLQAPSITCSQLHNPDTLPQRVPFPDHVKPTQEATNSNPKTAPKEEYPQMQEANKSTSTVSNPFAKEGKKEELGTATEENCTQIQREKSRNMDVGILQASSIPCDQLQKPDHTKAPQKPTNSNPKTASKAKHPPIQETNKSVNRNKTALSTEEEIKKKPAQDNCTQIQRANSSNQEVGNLQTSSISCHKHNALHKLTPVPDHAKPPQKVIHSSRNKEKHHQIQESKSINMEREDVTEKTFKVETEENCVQIQREKSTKVNDSNPKTAPKEKQPQTEEANKSIKMGKNPLAKTSVGKLRQFETVEDLLCAIKSHTFAANNIVLSTKPVVLNITENNTRKDTEKKNAKSGDCLERQHLNITSSDKTTGTMETASPQKMTTLAVDKETCTQIQTVNVSEELRNPSEEILVKSRTNTDNLKSAIELEKHNLIVQQAITKQLKQLLTRLKSNMECAKEVADIDNRGENRVTNDTSDPSNDKKKDEFLEDINKAPQSKDTFRKKKSNVLKTPNSNIYKHHETQSETATPPKVKRRLDVKLKMRSERVRDEGMALASPQTEEKKEKLRRKLPTKSNSWTKFNKDQRPPKEGTDPIKTGKEQRVMMVDIAPDHKEEKKPQDDRKQAWTTPKHEPNQTSKPVHVHGKQLKAGDTEKPKESEVVQKRWKRIRSLEPLPVEKAFDGKLGRKRHHSEVHCSKRSKDDSTPLKNSLKNQEVETAGKRRRTEEQESRRGSKGEKAVLHLDAQQDLKKAKGITSLKKSHLPKFAKGTNIEKPKEEVVHTVIPQSERYSKEEKEEEQLNHTTSGYDATLQNKADLPRKQNQKKGNTETCKSMSHKTGKDLYKFKELKSLKVPMDVATKFAKESHAKMQRASSRKDSETLKQLLTQKEKKVQRKQESKSERSDKSGHCKTDKTMSSTEPPQNPKRPSKSNSDAHKTDKRPNKKPSKDFGQIKECKVHAMEVSDSKKLIRHQSELEGTSSDNLALSVDKLIKGNKQQSKKPCINKSEVTLNEAKTEMPKLQKTESNTDNDHRKMHRTPNAPKPQDSRKRHPQRKSEGDNTQNQDSNNDKAHRIPSSTITKELCKHQSNEVKGTNSDYITMWLSVDKSIQEEEKHQSKKPCGLFISQVALNETKTEMPGLQNQEIIKENSSDKDHKKIDRTSTAKKTPDSGKRHPQQIFEEGSTQSEDRDAHRIPSSTKAEKPCKQSNEVERTNSDYTAMCVIVDKLLEENHRSNKPCTTSSQVTLNEIKTKIPKLQNQKRKRESSLDHDHRKNDRMSIAKKPQDSEKMHPQLKSEERTTQSQDNNNDNRDARTSKVTLNEMKIPKLQTQERKRENSGDHDLRKTHEATPNEKNPQDSGKRLPEQKSIGDSTQNQNHKAHKKPSSTVTVQQKLLTHKSKEAETQKTKSDIDVSKIRTLSSNVLQDSRELYDKDNCDVHRTPFSTVTEKACKQSNVVECTDSDYTAMCLIVDQLLEENHQSNKSCTASSQATLDEVKTEIPKLQNQERKRVRSSDDDHRQKDRMSIAKKPQESGNNGNREESSYEVALNEMRTEIPKLQNQERIRENSGDHDHGKIYGATPNEEKTRDSGKRHPERKSTGDSTQNQDHKAHWKPSSRVTETLCTNKSKEADTQKTKSDMDVSKSGTNSSNISRDSRELCDLKFKKKPCTITSKDIKEDTPRIRNDKRGREVRDDGSYDKAHTRRRHHDSKRPSNPDHGRVKSAVHHMTKEHWPQNRENQDDDRDARNNADNCTAHRKTLPSETLRDRELAKSRSPHGDNDQGAYQRTKDPRSLARMKREDRDARSTMLLANMSNLVSESYDQEPLEEERNQLNPGILDIEIHVFHKEVNKIKFFKDENVHNWSKMVMNPVPSHTQRKDVDRATWVKWQQVTNIVTELANPNLTFSKWGIVPNAIKNKSHCLMSFSFLNNTLEISIFSHCSIGVWACATQEDSTTWQRKSYFTANIEPSRVLKYMPRDGLERRDARERFDENEANGMRYEPLRRHPGHGHYSEYERSGRERWEFEETMHRRPSFTQERQFRREKYRFQTYHHGPHDIVSQDRGYYDELGRWDSM